MGKSYGPMVGCEYAVDWVKNNTPDCEMKDRVVARMQYEFDKDIPVPVKYHPGKYGHKYDSYACGNCGAGILEAHYKFCPSCGFALERSK